MKILAQITHCNNIIKILVKVPSMTQTSMPLTSIPQTSMPLTSIPQTSMPQTSAPITKSVSYHNIYKNFNMEKYIEDEKKYIKKMVKYYNE